ncbi:MAG: glycerol-3-phosphate 1-O-acyltransferase PlsY [Candidatus Omnitrophica bacterium]|nr:glycerol-3-phosphate 1-O-acyltransferase PlsY [Candidatus Omnitrophota bacterium]
MRQIITASIISYLIGSIPTAYIFGRVLKGIDIRKFGSGNVGATNALRVLGRWPAIAVLALDILKGFLPVLFLGNFFVQRINYLPQETVRLVVGLSCIAGHSWSLFLRFKGGKGIATTLGVLLALAIKVPGLNIVLALLVLSWFLIFAFTRIVSLASIVSAVLLPVYMLVFRQTFTLIFSSFILCAFAIIRHRSNLRRLWQGKEHRIKF